jgi:uncharacterized protein with GYD domain
LGEFVDVAWERRGGHMPKFMLEVQYTRDGLQGVLDKGGSARVEAATTGIESAGGTVEAFYFAFGHNDAYVVAEFPDNAAAAAVALTVGAAGGATVRTVALLTPDEVDRATQAGVRYRPPGA